MKRFVVPPFVRPSADSVRTMLVPRLGTLLADLTAANARKADEEHRASLSPGWPRLPRGRLPNGADPRVYYAADPEPVRDAFADAWSDRCDVAALARLRAREASGEAARDRAIVDAARARDEAARVAAQIERIRAQQRDGGAVEARARRYLAACPGGVSGQGRNDGAWRVVLAMVRGWGLGAAAYDMIMAEYAPRCSPPWRAVDVRGMVRRAERAERAGWGWLRDERRTE